MYYVESYCMIFWLYTLILKCGHWRLSYMECRVKIHPPSNLVYVNQNQLLHLCQSISVRDNMIHEIDKDALYGLKKLHTLKLVRCRLRFMPPVVHVKDTLLALILRGNLITYISHGYFKGFARLAILVLDKNHLVQFPDVRPLNQTLNTLFLSSNCISALPQNMIFSCCRLKYLRINENMLQTLNGSHFDGGNTAVKVSMSENPWRCDSSLAWLCNLDIGNFSEGSSVQQMQMSGRARFADYAKLKCAQPDLYAGVEIHTLSRFISSQYFVYTYIHRERGW